jgi:hypothetical protein
MKKTNLVLRSFLIVIILFIFSTPLYSQSKSGMSFYSGGHDSLLFDGANGNTFMDKSPCGCRIQIAAVGGKKVHARICEKQVGETCGQYDTFYVMKRRGIVSWDSDILDGDTIYTDDSPGSWIDLQLDDGKRLLMGRNSSMVVTGNCQNSPEVTLHNGLLFLDLTKGNKDNFIITRTINGQVINTGTRYSVQSILDGNDTIDIVRVYDGSVTFKQNLDAYTQSLKSKSEQIGQLSEDYQNGKISLEEFSKKMGELQQVLSESIPKGVTINAGYESRMRGTDKPTEPVPFDVNENRWWENK